MAHTHSEKVLKVRWSTMSRHNAMEWAVKKQSRRRRKYSLREAVSEMKVYEAVREKLLSCAHTR
eukprot:scaffold2266_cov166-Ochromonas_danica.AAC.18